MNSRNLFYVVALLATRSRASDDNRHWLEALKDLDNFKVEQEYAKVKVPLVMSPLQTGICMVAQASNDKDFNEVTCEDGVGLATEVGTYLSGSGIKVTMNYDISMTAMTGEQVNTILKNEAQTMHGEKQADFEKSYYEADGSVNGFWDFLGVHVGGKTGSSSDRSKITQDGKMTSTADDVFKAMQTNSKQKVRIRGTLNVELTDDFPKTTYVFIRIIHITYKDQKGEVHKMRCVSSDPKEAAYAGTKNGDDEGIVCHSKHHNVMPISD